MLALAGCTSQLPGNGSLAPPGVAVMPAPAGTGPDEESRANGTDFTAGLLPAADFGPGAYAEPFTAADRADHDPRQVPEGATLSPPECARPGNGAEEEPDVFAGQGVLVETGLLYIQFLQSPYKGTGLDPAGAGANVSGCESVTLTMPDGATVSMEVQPLDLGQLGDASTGLRIDSTGVSVDGQAFTTSTLMSYVADGDRVTNLAVTSLVPNQPVDEAAFLELVVKTTAYQHDALG